MKTNFALLGLEALAADKQIEAAALRQNLSTLQEARINMIWAIYAKIRKEAL